MAIKARNLIDEDDPRVSQIGHPAPPWLVNYADLMTEMVCFFIILYALSAALNKNIQNAAEVVKEMMEKGEIAGEVKIDKEGLRISIEEKGENVFFQSGKADLTEDMKKVLDKISPELYKLSEKHDIIVEGHTDNVPIATKLFASNWELSTARATGVVRYFLTKNFPPQRLAAIGYGEYHPKALNDTPENRRKNRRVVFFVKNEPYKDELKTAEYRRQNTEHRQQKTEDRENKTE